MPKIDIQSMALYLLLFVAQQVKAIEEPIYNLSGSEPIEEVLEKIGVPANSKFPIEIKKQNSLLKIDFKSKPENILSIDFNPAHAFTIEAKDLFERVETKDKGDIVGAEIIVSDPKSGRIFHLNSELKVSKLDIITPWNTKNKLKPIKEILAELNNNSIQLKPKRKKEIKK